MAGLVSDRLVLTSLVVALGSLVADYQWLGISSHSDCHASLWILLCFHDRGIVF